MDERQYKLGLKTCGAAILLTYIYLLIEIFYKLFSTRNIENCAWEIGLIILISATIIFVGRKDEAILLPKKIWGKELPIDLNGACKRERIKNYFLNSIIFSAAMVFTSLALMFAWKIPLDSYFMFSGVSKELNVTLNCFIEFLVLFVISLILDYSLGEYQIRKYNKKLKDLEGDK